MRLHLIVVGKLRSRELEAIEADYLKRMGPLSVQIHELKARAQNKSLEGDLILSKLQDLSKMPSEAYLLMERGREYTSEHFSDFVFAVLEQGKQLILIICGAEGPSNKLQAQVPRSISLSKLTFPHKIARIVLVEQIYRALTIKNKHPYHN